MTMNDDQGTRMMVIHPASGELVDYFPITLITLQVHATNDEKEVVRLAGKMFDAMQVFNAGTCNYYQPGEREGEIYKKILTGMFLSMRGKKSGSGNP